MPRSLDVTLVRVNEHPDDLVSCDMFGPPAGKQKPRLYITKVAAYMVSVPPPCLGPQLIRTAQVVPSLVMSFPFEPVAMKSNSALLNAG
jgi:hypothetical protein